MAIVISGNGIDMGGNPVSNVAINNSVDVVDKDYVDTGAGVANTITGGATTITTSNLTASRALMSDANGKVAVSAVTSTELEYLSGVTSSVQAQLNAKQATLVSGTNIKTVNGTSILGSGDITISSTAPTTAQVGTATAGLDAGAVGSYAFLYNTDTVSSNPGTTKAGSFLKYISSSLPPERGGNDYSVYTISSSSVTGTWRCMGLSAYWAGGYTYYGITLWLRIA